VPAFSVFQTPPDAAAMYQVLLSSGSTAISTMRPDMNAGPISRRLKSEIVEEVSSGGPSGS